MENNNFGQELAKQTLDQIPQASANAKRIVGLVKEGGRITGYQLSDNSIVEKQQAVDMAKQGQIAGVGIAHRGDTEYLKSIPDGSENNNLGNLPSVPPIPKTLTAGISGGFSFHQSLRTRKPDYIFCIVYGIIQLFIYHPHDSEVYYAFFYEFHL
jgi:hypothetical protein